VVDDSFQEQKYYEDNEQPEIATLLPSSEIDSSNHIKAWRMSNLEEETIQADKKVSDDVYQKMQQEMQPEIQKQAEIIKKETYEKAFEQGYQEGLKKGQEEGYTVGQTEAKSEVFANVQPKLDQFDSILTSLKAPYDSLEQRIYSELVDFALHIAKTVIKKEVQADKEWILNTVKESVSALPESSSEIKIYLHPDDLAFLQISQPSISEKWSLHENPKIDLGTCIVKQDYSTILNSWIARFDEVEEQVSQDVSDSSNASIPEISNNLESSSTE